MSQGPHYERPPVITDPSTMVEVADRTWVIPDAFRTPHVPNVGIVVGDRAALIVDSGLGARNAERVLAALRSVTDLRRVYLTQTHFHPEHGYGAQRLRDDVTIVYNADQYDELLQKGEEFLVMFRGFSTMIAEALEDVTFVRPDITFDNAATLDLGGREVQLVQRGPAHTRGDQSVYLPDVEVLFTGDLVEERFFPILPDEDAGGSAWIAALAAMQTLSPAVVVPGHGAIGDGELLSGYHATLVGWQQRVAAALAGNDDVSAVVDRLEAELHAEHPDWDNREWVAPMLRQFAAEL